MNEKQISESLYRWLEPYGIIKWHKNSSHSFYLKFKDVRLGSIRIANHKGRERYHYTYEIFVKDKDVESRMEEIIQAVQRKSEKIANFDPEKYVVWDTEQRIYKEVPDFKSYQSVIFKR